MINSYQKEYFRRNSKVHLDYVIHQYVKHMNVNEHNVYDIQNCLRNLYKNNPFLLHGMDYEEYINHVTSSLTLSEDYKRIIFKDIDYNTTHRAYDKIFH